MPQLFDAVIARIMLYCLRHVDGYKYQRISREMGYSDGRVHKFCTGEVGSGLFLKCVGSYFAKYGSHASQLAVMLATRRPGLLGSLLFTGVRHPEFVRVARQLLQDTGCFITGVNAREHSGSCKVLEPKSLDVGNDADEVRVPEEDKAV
jgi:hypothetical protein